MLKIIVGVPGSGKTFYAVNYLYDVFKDDKSKLFNSHSHFFTNINEFRFDLFPENVGYKFDFDDFYSKLTTLHYCAVVSKMNDSELKEQAKELNLLNSLVIIDEAQNYFDRDDKVLVWWLSYHRHLHQDILLLTQNLALFYAKYKSFCETFYRAIPSSFRIFSNFFLYKCFSGARMAQTQYLEMVKIKFNKDVYSLYHSGANTQGKKHIMKFALSALVVFLVLCLIVFLFFSRLHSSYDSNDSNDSAAPVASLPASNSNIKNSLVPSLKTYEDIRLLCGSSMCVYRGVTLTNSDIDNLKRKYNFELLSVTPFSPDFQIYIYRSKIGVSNEILAGTF